MPRITLLAVLAILSLGKGPVSRAEQIDFLRDVVPALTKSGCNAGACHGSFQGRGGLRLSLLGFDPAADYRALAQEARGRRVFPASPEASLILRKATLALPHGGGQRMTQDSAAHAILAGWIEQGLQPPQSELKLQSLSVEPAELVLQPGKEARLKVISRWSDEVVRDVTQWSQFELPQKELGSVSAAGIVKATGPGRAAITIRFLDHVLAVPMSVPFGESDPFEFPRSNFVDDLLVTEWQKLGLKPGPLAAEEEFLRRVYLDLIGTLPTPEEARRFLNDKDAAKRARLIDELLDRPEYVDYWALKWSDLLRAHRRALGEKGMASFQSWLQQRLRENLGFDQIAQELLTAEGNLFTRGPVAFYFIDKTPEEIAETTAQVFLGIRLTCARCHHHPFEVWGQDDYYALASFFTGVVRKDNKESGAYGGVQSLRAGRGDAMRHPTTGIPLPPRAFGWTPNESGLDVRKELAGWLTRTDNKQFSRTVVNRYWAVMFGRGLVHPVDDLSTTNPPVFPQVLDSVAADFVTHKYDLKHLLRTLCNSSAYQLAGSAGSTSNEHDRDERYFTRRTPARMPAEVLLDAVNQATGTSEGFAGFPPGTRAISLPDSNVDSYFLTTFGRPRRTSSCDCERTSKLDLAQVLHLANSEKLQSKLSDQQGRIASLLKSGKPEAEVIEELYLATLTRLPEVGEKESVERFFATVPSRQEGLEDLLWTLLNCSEFAMNH